MRTIRRAISRQSRFCPSRLCPSRLRPSRFCMVAATAGHLAACLGIGSSASADSPFASAVISYVAGTGAATGFTNAASTLGSPERFSGEGLIPGAVTPFQPAFRPDEIVSLGVGGSLVVTFDHDVTDASVYDIRKATINTMCRLVIGTRQYRNILLTERHVDTAIEWLLEIPLIVN